MKELMKEKSTQHINEYVNMKGFLSDDLFQQLVTQTILTLPKQHRDTVEKLARKKALITEALEDINPQDVTEGMLAAQMIAVNDMAMHCLAISDGMGSIQV